MACSLISVRWHRILIWPINDDVLFDHLIKVMSAQALHSFPFVSNKHFVRSYFETILLHYSLSYFKLPVDSHVCVLCVCLWYSVLVSGSVTVTVYFDMQTTPNLANRAIFKLFFFFFFSLLTRSHHSFSYSKTFEPLCVLFLPQPWNQPFL